MQILKPPPVKSTLSSSTNRGKIGSHKNTSAEATTALSSTSSPLATTLTPSFATGGAYTDDDQNGNSEPHENPYEDAIKEALDLLRKHRSPPASPAVGQVGDRINGMAQPFPTTVNVARSNNRGMTVVEMSATKDERDASQDDIFHNAVDSSDGIRPIMSDNPDGGSENLADALQEAKLKAKQRQERMAEYANRLQEFKSSLPPEQLLQPSSSYQSRNSPVPTTEEVPSDEQPRFIHQVASADSAGIISELSHSSKPVPQHHSYSTQLPSQQQQDGEDRRRVVEEEVQKGVEKVLLAILEASRSKGASSASDLVGNDAASANSCSGDVSEALLRAVDEVLHKGSSDTNSRNDWAAGGSSSTSRLSVGAKSQVSYRSKQSGGERSVVDELLAEADDPAGWPLEEKKVTEETPVMSIARPSSSSIDENNIDAMIEETLRESPTPGDEQTEGDDDVRSDDSTDDDGFEEEDDEGDDVNTEVDDDESYDDDDDNVEYDSNDGGGIRQGVLGPLSRKAGGTTGVVLDVNSGSVQEEKRGSESYFSSLLNYVTSAPTSEQQRMLQKTRENGPAGDDVASENLAVNIEDVDVEAMDLMRTLCAHLLPFGVDRISNTQQALPEWDEDNMNEAGYRIIRLSRPQLRRVERAFEAMITGLKNKSQSQLHGLEGELDANFIRELQEAERLLDDQEKETQGSQSGKTVAMAKSQEAEAAVDFEKPVEGAVSECTHPDFPGVKGTGGGEMGDLEYFHLPIIFKSHVTGFEPTKDMVLEPGNVVAGQYLVESELGSAAFSTAYRCIDLSSSDQDDHEEVCLKVIKNTKDFFDQSLDEIKILELLRQTGKCDENYIVRMKTFFYYREHLIIVTELLRQNLFEFGKFIIDNDEEPYFTISRLAYITRQCLIALRFVHGLNLVHSDVKPENILLGSYSRAQIKLIDFGSSCYLTDRQSSYIQSRSYRAPEVVLGLPYDGRIDVWSLGCVVAEMFTGEVTFQNDSIVSMLSRIEAICGSFPRHMIAQGRQSGRFFTKSGLLYEVVDDSEREARKNPPGPNDDDDESADSGSETSVLFDIFQPKNTRLSSRLGFDPDLMEDYEPEKTAARSHKSEHELKQLFTDFVGRLLTIDPHARPTADEALNHPFMIYASTLTEEKIKYPSS